MRGFLRSLRLSPSRVERRARVGLRHVHRAAADPRHRRHGLLVAGLVLSESKPTTQQRKTVATVNAAESGFEVALAPVARREHDSYGNGTLNNASAAPPTSSAVGTPITGSVGPKSGAAKNQTLTYTVYVRYYETTPAPWAPPTCNQHAIACSGGSPVSVPQYAYLQSNGAGIGGASAPGYARATGTLHTTYRFKTSNLNIAGGRLNMNTTRCAWTRAASPSVGTNVTLSTCPNRGVSARAEQLVLPRRPDASTTRTRCPTRAVRHRTGDSDVRHRLRARS